MAFRNERALKEPLRGRNLGETSAAVIYELEESMVMDFEWLSLDSRTARAVGQNVSRDAYGHVQVQVLRLDS